jgi:hypothetical protein
VVDEETERHGEHNNRERHPSQHRQFLLAMKRFQAGKEQLRQKTRQKESVSFNRIKQEVAQASEAKDRFYHFDDLEKHGFILPS